MASVAEQMVQLRVMERAFIEVIDAIGKSREMSLAKTRIEEAVMWATKHLSR